MSSCGGSVPCFSAVVCSCVFPFAAVVAFWFLLYSSLTGIILEILWSGTGNWLGQFLLSINIQVFENILQEILWSFVQA
jgi:hypothetical protein